MTDPDTPRVLIVEDEPTLAAGLAEALGFQGYHCEVAPDGRVALDKARRRRFDVMLLDIMLPHLSGFEVIEALRAEGNNVPIIMLTARGQEIDKVLGLKLGADDYITKPFSFLELMARVEAVLRRAGGPQQRMESYNFGDVVINFKSCQATKDGKPVELSPRELELMRFFVEHRGEVVTRDQLLDSVWGYDNMPYTRTVDMHIAKLRKKIEDKPNDPKFIVTVHRLGYKFTG